MLNMHPMGAIFIISEYIRFGTTPLIIGAAGNKGGYVRCCWRCGSVETCRKAARVMPAASFFLPEGEGAQQKTYGTGEP